MSHDTAAEWVNMNYVRELALPSPAPPCPTPENLDLYGTCTYTWGLWLGDMVVLAFFALMVAAVLLVARERAWTQREGPR